MSAFDETGISRNHRCNNSNDNSDYISDINNINTELGNYETSSGGGRGRPAARSRAIEAYTDVWYMIYGFTYILFAVSALQSSS